MLFVADKDLAEFICNYVLEEHEMIDDDMTLEDNIKDYYVSLYFTDEQDYFFCEDAKGNSGEYKLSDLDDELINYFIFNDMDKDTAFDKLVSENGTWSWNEVVWECDEDEVSNENPYEYTDCEKCNEIDNCLENGKCCRDCDCGDDERIEEFDYGELLEIFTCRIIDAGKDFKLVRDILDEFADIFIPDYEEMEDEFEITEDDIIDESADKCNDCEDKQVCLDISIIEEFYDKIENLDCDCSSCVKNVLYELFLLGKEIGWKNHKGFMKKILNS